MNKLSEALQENDILVSLRRTIVPIIVGFLLARAVRLGFDIPSESLTGVVEAVVTGVYYTVVRLIESVWPSAGALLGARKQPRY